MWKVTPWVGYVVSFLTRILGAIGLLFLTGCASSDLSRRSATEVDNVYDSSQNIGNNSDPFGAYRNASQAVKGGIIGGAAGAIIGTASSAVGTVPGALGGAVFGAAMGAYIDTRTTWHDKLENAGGQVLVLGDQIKIIIPSATLFHSMTGNFNASAYKTLDRVASYLRTFDKISVKVAAYTNATGPARINQELSQQQADSVARYLWFRGINTRLLTAVGYGGNHLVRQNSYEWNENENYRIEITVEKL